MITEEQKQQAKMNLGLMQSAAATGPGAFQLLCGIVHQNAKSKGFHNDGKTREEFMERHLALTICECAEGLEAIRAGKMDAPCDKAEKMAALGLKPLTCIEEELADVMIRTMDQAQRIGIDLFSAIINKHAYNTTRPALHGKKF